MNEGKRLSVLDSLRGIAAFGIAFFWHYQHFNPKYGFPFSGKAYWFYHFGANLVDFFFVISGFIFSYVYMNKIVNKTVSAKEFSIFRFSRLYPLHFITLITVALLQYIRFLGGWDPFQYPNNDVYHFILNVFFIQFGWFESGFSFNGPSWSLAAEIVAYVLFFIILSKFGKNKRYIYFYVFLIFLGMYINKTNLNYPLLNTNMSRVFIGFFIGCIVYILNEKVEKSKIKNRIICGVAILLGIVVFNAITFGHKTLGNWTFVYTVFIYPSIIVLALNIGILTRILRIKPLLFLGNLSYSMYLWHFPVQITIKTLDDAFKLNINYSSKWIFVIFVLTTIAVSTVSYYFVEKPLLKYFREKLLIYFSIKPKLIEKKLFVYSNVAGSTQD